MSSPATRVTTSKFVQLPLVLAILIGFAFALYRFGYHVLDPLNITWFQGDSTWHFLVWHFFRREAWGVPPGQVKGFMAPLGTSIGRADALPILAFPLKLFSAALPPDFQYLGPWLFVSYALQGAFGYLLARTFCGSRWLALLAGLFFLFSPVMIFRAVHIALASHWVLLFALWHYFKAAKRPDFRLPSYAGLWLLITALVGLIHPYLATMVFPVALVSLWREWRFSKRLALRPALALFTALSATLALEWWASGLIGAGQNLELWGFDHFSMNLNALINPLTRSRVLPLLPTTAGQYEGFAYLGLGMLALGVLTLFLRVRARLPWWRARTPEKVGLPRRAFARLRASGHLPLALLALGFFLFSLGRSVMLGEGRLLELPLFTRLTTLTGTFRASGRFFWLPYYLLYLLILAYLVRRLAPRPAAFVLGAGLLLQLSDLKLNAPFVNASQTFSQNLDDTRWERLIVPFQTVAVIPAFERTTANRGDYAEFAYLAAKGRKRVTTGAVARPPLGLDNIKARLQEEVLVGPRNPKTLYVFGAVEFATSYLTKLEPGLRCYALGDYVACHDAAAGAKNALDLGAIDLKSYTPSGYRRLSLAAYLSRHAQRTIVLVAQGGGGEVASGADNLLTAAGSQLGRLAPGEAYVAVLHKGDLVFEDSGEDEPLRQLWVAGDPIGGEGDTDVGRLVAPKNLRVFSEGAAGKQRAQLLVGGVPVGRLDRGLNVAVLDERFEVLSFATFDTFVTDEGVVKE